MVVEDQLGEKIGVHRTCEAIAASVSYQNMYAELSPQSTDGLAQCSVRNAETVAEKLRAKGTPGRNRQHCQKATLGLTGKVDDGAVNSDHLYRAEQADMAYGYRSAPLDWHGGRASRLIEAHGRDSIRSIGANTG